MFHNLNDLKHNMRLVASKIDFFQQKITSFFILLTIAVISIVFLAGCGPSVDCNNGSVKDTAIELTEKIIIREYGNAVDFDLSLSDIETVEKKNDSCTCTAEVIVEIDGDEVSTAIIYEVTKARNGDIEVVVTLFDI
jgi:hypothetical protein